MSDDVVIVSAARTPVGSFNGAFATTPAHDLGAIAIKAALERAGVPADQVTPDKTFVDDLGGVADARAEADQ